MNDTPLAKVFVAFNNILDSKMGTSLGLRKWVEKATYQGTFQSVNLSKQASRVFPKPGKKSPAERPEDSKKSDFFDLRLSEEQEMIQQTIQQFATQYMRKNAEQLNIDCKISDNIVQEFQALGLPYYSVPESLGGVLTEKATVTQMIIAEELAYGDLGMAVALLAPTSALNAITQFGTSGQQEQYIPAFLDEQKPLSAVIAINEPSALFDPFQLSTKAVKSGSKYIINGIKASVPLVNSSELFLVAAEIEGHGPAIFIVESSQSGVSVESQNAMGLRPAALGNITLNNVEVSDDAKLGGDTLDYATLISYVRLGWCSLAIGTARAILDQVIPYANERIAFGEPISNRQSVAFMIANIRIELDTMQVLTQRAAALAEQGKPFQKEAYLAAVSCQERAMDIGNDGVQLFGGLGFMRDYPAERWYRDLRAVSWCFNGMHL
ncbi:MAG TPA: acyl-CoA dehydrogenase family protein [Chitinophagales bacterium]|nr:acyl-CoA dehydrogenase family protein [Chitinophagales bacterium]